MLNKLLEVYLTVVVEINLTDDIIELLAGALRALLVLDELADLFFVDESVVVCVEHFEGFFELFLSVSVTELRGKGEELAESDES